MRRYKSVKEAVANGQNTGFFEIARNGNEENYTVKWRLRGDIIEWRDENNTDWDELRDGDYTHEFNMGVAACLQNFSLPQDIIEELR